MNYTKYLSNYGCKVRPPVIRDAMKKVEDVKDLLSIAPGCPNPETFPITAMTFKLRDGTTIELSESELEAAQQYGSTQGMPMLREIFVELQRSVHDPPTCNYTDERQMKICITPGSQNSIYQAVRLFHSENDCVLTEKPGFHCAGCPSLTMTGMDIIEVDMDTKGMDPTHLQRILSEQNEISGAKAPRVLWTCPTCNNPQGISYSLERKQQIYALAHEFDLLIIEDDAYYYLQENTPRTPSFLSMDVDGRVLRFDTFAKVIAPGLRVGFVTGPKVLVDTMECMLMESIQHTSTLSQMIVYKLFKHWSIDGFLSRARKLSEFYTRKRDVTIQKLNKYLEGLAEWNVPTGGALFVWLTIPSIKSDSASFVDRLVKTKRVVVVPGWAFFAKPPATLHVRICLSIATDDYMDECLNKLAEFIKEEQDTQLMK